MLSLVRYVILSLLCATEGHVLYYKRNGEVAGRETFNSGSSSPEHVKWRRLKRAIIYKLGKAVLEGMSATRTILRGSKPAISATANVRVYEKSGGYGQAVRDFFSVRPIGVFALKIPGAYRGVIGKVGDRQIQIRNRDMESDWKPIMKIIRSLPSGEKRIYIIVYEN